MKISTSLAWTVIILPWLLGISACKRDDAGPQVRADWKSWIASHSQQIRSVSAADADYSDLRFLAPLLAGKSVLQLAASASGVAEFDLANVRLIKYLHEELGFDVIAIESPFYTCGLTNEQIDALPAEEMMGRSLYKSLQREEICALFDYVKTCRNSTHPLHIAGFDVLYESSPLINARPAMLKQIIAAIDPVMGNTIEHKDTSFLSKENDPYWMKTQQFTFIDIYTNLYKWIDAHMDELLAAYPQNPRLPKLVRQTLAAMVPYIKQKIYGGSERFNQRALGMADNIAYLREHMYPGKKMVLWTHSRQAQYNLAAMAGQTDLANLGYWLAQRDRTALYTIGLFMYAGEAARDNRETYTISTALPDSLEAIMYYAAADYAYCDFSQVQQTPGTAWIDSLVAVKEDGLVDYTILPREQYDGVLFMRTVHPPTFVTYYPAYGNSALQQH